MRPREWMQERLRGPGGDRLWACIAVFSLVGTFLAGIGTGNSASARADRNAYAAQETAREALEEVRLLREEQVRQAERFALYNSRKAALAAEEKHAAEHAAQAREYQNAMTKLELKIIAEIRANRGK